MTARPDDPDFRELCHCCGGDGIYVDSCSDCAGKWSVGCTTCGLHNNADTRADALAAWNRRAALEPQDAPAMAEELVALRAENARLKEALTFYANPEVYRPHPHGPAFDRRDVSYVATAALTPEAKS